MHFSAVDETGVAINQEDAIAMANAGIGYKRLLWHREPPTFIVWTMQPIGSRIMVYQSPKEF
jgi:hypothetical protein